MEASTSEKLREYLSVLYQFVQEVMRYFNKKANNNPLYSFGSMAANAAMKAADSMDSIVYAVRNMEDRLSELTEKNRDLEWQRDELTRKLHALTFKPTADSRERFRQTVMNVCPGINAGETQDSAIDVILGYIQQGQKISAIKEVRYLFNLGLKEAKDVVEAYANI